MIFVFGYKIEKFIHILLSDNINKSGDIVSEYFD